MHSRSFSSECKTKYFYTTKRLTRLKKKWWWDSGKIFAGSEVLTIWCNLLSRLYWTHDSDCPLVYAHKKIIYTICYAQRFLTTSSPLYFSRTGSFESHTSLKIFFWFYAHITFCLKPTYNFQLSFETQATNMFPTTCLRNKSARIDNKYVENICLKLVYHINQTNRQPFIYLDQSSCPLG